MKNCSIRRSSHYGINVSGVRDAPSWDEKLQIPGAWNEQIGVICYHTGHSEWYDKKIQRTVILSGRTCAASGREIKGDNISLSLWRERRVSGAIHRVPSLLSFSARGQFWKSHHSFWFILPSAGWAAHSISHALPSKECHQVQALHAEEAVAFL